jgi:hypothetical protein
MTVPKEMTPEIAAVMIVCLEIINTPKIIKSYGRRKPQEECPTEASKDLYFLILPLILTIAVILNVGTSLKILVES